MSRTLPAGVSGVLGDDVIYPAIAIDLEFDSQNVYLWSGLGDLVVGAKTYIGSGKILTISNLEETAQVKAAGATLQLSGIPSDILSLALAEPYQGRPARIYFVIIDPPNTDQNFAEIFSGFIDKMDIEETGETCVIQCKIENELIRLERPSTARFTSEYQKSRYPGDLGLDFIESLQNTEFTFGRPSSS